MGKRIDNDRSIVHALAADPGDPRRVTGLTRRLEDDARAIIHTIDSPVGSLLLCIAPTGLVRVAFTAQDGPDPLESLVDHFAGLVMGSARLAEPYTRAFGQYFDGSAHRVDVPVDLQLVRSPYRRIVVEHLARIPYGTTASYAQVAHDTGRPRAVRAVGSACALNPVPIALPCHRVVRSGGELGNYAGGREAKAALLALESEHLV